MNNDVVSENFMNQMAAGIEGTITETMGEKSGVGFILITVSEAGDGSTDFKYVSNIQETQAIKELMTQLVTHDETKN